MHKKLNISGIILAGGKNTRMGQNKALLVWRGKRLIDWVIDAVSPLCNEIIISSNEDLPDLAGSHIVKDRFEDSGPAAGIESGLLYSRTELNLVASCDTPLISTDLFAYLVSKHGEYEISIPVHGMINEPLIGVYNKSVQQVFEKAISMGLNKPPVIIRSCNYQEVPVSDELNFYHKNLFVNLNSPEDLIRTSK